MHPQEKAATPVNMPCLNGWSAENAERFTADAHGPGMARSEWSGAVSVDWTMAQNTATTPRRWMRNRCRNRFLRRSIPL